MQEDIKPRICRSFSFAFRSCSDDVRHVLAQTRMRLFERGVDMDSLGTVELVLCEVLNNVVEHAYASCASGPVWLRCRHEARGLRILLADEGVPMPHKRLPTGAPPDTGVCCEELPEGGFGWYLVRELSRDLSYRRAGGRNRLGLVIPFEAT